MSDLSSTVAAVFAQQRRDLGLTLEEVGRRSGIHRTTVGLIERNRRSPTLDTAQRLAMALELRLSTIVADFERLHDDHRS